ncbi:hypothetical protein FALBO_14224 [Fusarium albosuccineum]|uniref:Uncharacterized protein n=1 Tax=Fusarium albosuccineum TaxID=1237068 RepID=A0A8H4L0L0_9HYPO|nr:hypothetical protein FALBO_14224 [Fusarium albosuccineum]
MFFINSITPEFLYHTLLVVVDYHIDPSGANRSTYVLGTHATLDTARSFAYRALRKLGYTRKDFSEYAVRTLSAEWKYGNDVLAYAKASAGQAFLVSVHVAPNNESLLMQADGSVILPRGIESLHYVVRVTFYNIDRADCEQETEIEGTYARRADACAAALKWLDPADFTKYDRVEDLAEAWPFGDDVLVHSVSSPGQDTTVVVRTVTNKL